LKKWAKKERELDIKPLVIQNNVIIFQETALVFVKEGDFDCLTQLLSPVEFARLKPLVLLLGWPYCYSCENAKNLLEALWNPTVSFGLHNFHYFESY